MGGERGSISHPTRARAPDARRAATLGDMLRKLHDAARAIADCADVEGILQAGQGAAVSAFGCPARVMLTPEAEVGSVLATPGSWRPVVRGCVVARAAAFTVDELGGDAEARGKYDGYRFAVGAAGGEPRCLLGVARAPHGDAELELLCALATLIAGAVEQIRMRNAALAEQERRLRLARYFSPHVAAALAERAPGPRRATATVLFCDVRGFTAYCDEREPELVLELLGRWFDIATRVVFEHGGMVDKLLGDGMMAAFGVPEPTPDAAGQAIRCAATLVERARDVDLDGTDSGLRVGVGVHTGPVVVGDLGSDTFVDFTVLGATVNLASRLESMTKELGVPVVISDAARRAAGDPLGLRSLGPHAVRGVREPVTLFALDP